MKGTFFWHRIQLFTVNCLSNYLLNIYFQNELVCGRYTVWDSFLAVCAMDMHLQTHFNCEVDMEQTYFNSIHNIKKAALFDFASVY